MEKYLALIEEARLSVIALMEADVSPKNIRSTATEIGISHITLRGFISKSWMPDFKTIERIESYIKSRVN